MPTEITSDGTATWAGRAGPLRHRGFLGRPDRGAGRRVRRAPGARAGAVLRRAGAQRSCPGAPATGRSPGSTTWPRPAATPSIFISGRGATSITDMPPEFREFYGSMISMDDPRHARLRRIVSRGFTPKRLAGLTAEVERTARTIVDDVIATGGCDAVSADLRAAAAEDRLRHDGRAGEPVRVRLRPLQHHPRAPPTPSTSPTPTTSSWRCCRPGNELAELMRDLGAHRTAHPTDDVTSALVNAEIDGERLTPDELASFFILLVVAGQRDHPQRHQLGSAAAHRAPRPARRVARRPRRCHAHRRRGDRPVGVTGDLHAAHPGRRRGARRAADGRGRQGGAVLLGGQPRPCAFRRPGRVRRPPLAQPARRVRRPGPALLPRRAPGPPGDGGDVPGAAHPRARHPRHGASAAAAVDVHQRDQAPAGRVRTRGAQAVPDDRPGARRRLARLPGGAGRGASGRLRAPLRGPHGDPFRRARARASPRCTSAPARSPARSAMPGSGAATSSRSTCRTARSTPSPTTASCWPAPPSPPPTRCCHPLISRSSWPTAVPSRP